MVNYYGSSFDSTNIFLKASIVLLTVGSGYLARAGMRYSDAATDDAISQDFAACSGCMHNNLIMTSDAESLRARCKDTCRT